MKRACVFLAAVFSALPLVHGDGPNCGCQSGNYPYQSYPVPSGTIIYPSSSGYQLNYGVTTYPQYTEMVPSGTVISSLPMTEYPTAYPSAYPTAYPTYPETVIYPSQEIVVQNALPASAESTVVYPVETAPIQYSDPSTQEPTSVSDLVYGSTTEPQPVETYPSSSVPGSINVILTGRVKDLESKLEALKEEKDKAVEQSQQLVSRNEKATAEKLQELSLIHI